MTRASDPCNATVDADRSLAILEVLRVALDGSTPTTVWRASLPALPRDSAPGAPSWGLWASATGQRILLGVDGRIVELDTSRF